MAHLCDDLMFIQQCCIYLVRSITDSGSIQSMVNTIITIYVNFLYYGTILFSRTPHPTGAPVSVPTHCKVHSVQRNWFWTEKKTFMKKWALSTTGEGYVNKDVGKKSLSKPFLLNNLQWCLSNSQTG